MFWSLTLDLFLKLTERHKDREQRKDQRAGVIAAAVHNAQRSKRTDRYLTWLDFFPEAKPAPRMQTDEEMLAVMQTWAKTQNQLAN